MRSVRQDEVNKKNYTRVKAQTSVIEDNNSQRISAIGLSKKSTQVITG